VVTVNYRGMSTYISPYYCIATSGTTRDGRVIKPEWLTSAAETYDPEEAEALLWYDHSRWYNPGGAVVDCKAKLLDDKRVQLLARIKPTTALMFEAENSEVPYLFSVELRPMEDGRYYLDGLAYTHDPASRAVDKMEFSQQRPDIQLCDTETVDKLEFKTKGLLSRLFSKAPPAPPTKRIEPNALETETFTPQGTDEMTPEQFEMLKQVNAKLDTFQQSLDDLKTKQAEFSTLETTITETFSKLETAQKETHTIVEEIGNASSGRFRPYTRNKFASGGAGDNAADASELDY
jgi:hypothetical protein